MRRILVIGLILALLTGLFAIPGQAADEGDILAAINSGVPWLAGQQNPDGSWGTLAEVDYWGAGFTGLAVVKLEDYAYENDYDSPFDPEYEYSGNVTAGLNYIFSQAGNNTCDPRIRFSVPWYTTYNTGIAMMAIANSGNMSRVVEAPSSLVDGWTYQEVLEANVDWFENSQLSEGAWGYGSCPYGEFGDNADNSNSGYATLGLRYAEAAGISIPQSIKEGLNNWIGAIQDPVDGDVNDGGSWYETGWPWVNLLKTGNLLFQMAFVGNTTGAPAAIDYIERHWNDPDSDPGWKGVPGSQPHYQAMYALMKGFEALGIETIQVDSDEVDWYEEFADAIVGNQTAGHWGPSYWGGSYVLATEWALLTLELVAPPQPTIEVPVDIKPTSCRNPLNVKDKGILPVAVLGTDSFDVSQIDPSTVKLGNVIPLRWAMEDVATPYEPYTGKVDAFDCTEAGPDGFTDLTFKFKTQEVVADMGAVNDGDVLVLQLTGNLMEEYGGTPIVGEDVIVILKKGK